MVGDRRLPQSRVEKYSEKSWRKEIAKTIAFHQHGIQGADLDHQKACEPNGGGGALKTKGYTRAITAVLNSNTTKNANTMMIH